MARKSAVYAVVPAAGKGKRLMRKTPKAHLAVAGKPLFIHTLRALYRAFPFRAIVLAVDASLLFEARKQLVKHGLSRVRLTAGGPTRAESVMNGLNALPAGKGLVAVHDAARPLISRDVVKRTVEAAKKSKAAICAMPVTSTVKRIHVKSGVIRKTEDRRELFLAQTPQVFDRDLLLARYKRLGKRAFLATDEAALFDGTNVRVKVVQGDERNIKVTTPADLEHLKKALGGRKGGRFS